MCAQCTCSVELILLQTNWWWDEKLYIVIKSLPQSILFPNTLERVLCCCFQNICTIFFDTHAFVSVYWWLFNDKSIFIQIYSSISNNSIKHKYNFNVKSSSVSNNSVWHAKTILFQTIWFSISTQFISIWPIDRALSGSITPSHGGPGSDRKEVLRISKSSSIIWTSPSDCLVA